VKNMKTIKKMELEAWISRDSDFGVDIEIDDA